VYGAAHRLRQRWYESRCQRLKRPVVSIGNLHWGGAGKTPLTAAIAEHLRDRGHQVAILTRGYKSEGRGIRVVSTGEGPLLGPLVAGDEPVLLAGKLPGVAVIVSPDRYRAGQHALERVSPTPEIFLLDDGFSHLQLHRDLDLLVFPAADPFAGARLPPGGRLREPLASAERAHAVLLTGPEAAGGAELAQALRPFGFSGPGFASPTTVLPALDQHDREVAGGASALLVSAVARPNEVAATAEGLSYDLLDVITFPDHHAYPAESLALIQRRFRASGADFVLTTEKDWVKLLGRAEVPLARMPLRSSPEPAFGEWLDQQLAPLLSAAER
jgi:tetraacyldisaccharide 4'-kinase